ncbi:hypothetical protein AB0D91_06225 [Streptomyces canus]|uniref:hypothetical protein n=1 Tax=Streptomyces canus TaxID=58343 RepID=UPI0033EFB396
MGTPRRRILRSRWKPGPAIPLDDVVLVGVTEFTAHGYGQSVAVALAGMRLRRTWPSTPGAVGMWLFADPLRRRSGSVSVWADERGLKEFTGRPTTYGSCVRIVDAVNCGRSGGSSRSSTPMPCGRTPWT